MSYTMQQIVTQARTFLNDASATRNSDATLLTFANEWITLARRVRPDLFVTQYASLPENLLITANFPVDDGYYDAIVNYVVARAEFEDDEYAVDGRAKAAYELALAGLGAS